MQLFIPWLSATFLTHRETHPNPEQENLGKKRNIYWSFVIQVASTYHHKHCSFSHHLQTSISGIEV
jgi:hypothetical protein